MPRLSCSSEDGTGSGGRTLITYTLGEVARLIGAEIDRVESWARNRWIIGTGGGQGPGKHKAFSQTELEIARRALQIAQRYNVNATEAMFTEARQRLQRKES